MSHSKEKDATRDVSLLNMERLYDPVPLKRIVDIYVEVFSAPPRNERIDKDAIYEKYQQVLPESIVHVVKDMSEVIGFIISVPSRYFAIHFSGEESTGLVGDDGYYLSDFALLERYRRNNIGQRLLTLHFAELESRGKPVYARSRTDVPNVISLFQKQGMSIIYKYSARINSVTTQRYIYKKVYA